MNNVEHVFKNTLLDVRNVNLVYVTLEDLTCINDYLRIKIIAIVRLKSFLKAYKS